MRRVKILITGAFNAGKTEFIQSACKGRAVTSERVVTGQQALVKRMTTVALDFGKVISNRGNQLLLFGSPGQRRFAFDRDVLARGAMGSVLMVDSCDEASLSEARELVSWLLERSVPFVVAANKQDRPGALSGDALRLRLALAEEIKVVECSALQRETVLEVLADLEGVVCDKCLGVTM